MIEAAGECRAIHVPLTAVIRAIAKWLQQFGQQLCPGGPHASTAAPNARHRIAANLLGVIAGEQRSPCRPAASRVVELRESQAVFGEPVEIWCTDFAAVTAEIAKS